MAVERGVAAGAVDEIVVAAARDCADDRARSAAGGARGRRGGGGGGREELDAADAVARAVGDEEAPVRHQRESARTVELPSRAGPPTRAPRKRTRDEDETRFV